MRSNDQENDCFFLFIGVFFFIADFSGGYRLDEQVSYPSDGKHSVKLLRHVKKMFVFKRKRNRHLFFKAAVIQQIIGYVQLLFWWGMALLFFISGHQPNTETVIILAVAICSLQILYTLIVILYYRILKILNEKINVK